jgi:DNA invertase Pin-like site-specific DNA recombinase
MEKVICYYRVSTKGQGESGLGLEAQRAYIEHFVKSSGNYEIVQEFTEIASGKNMDCKKRPQLCEALELCRKHGYLLAVAKLDRLSRTTSHILNIFETLEGRLISCDIPNLDKFTLTIFGAIAERERELISIRTKQALQARKVRHGKIKFTEKGGDNLRNTGAHEKANQANREKAARNENNIRAHGMAAAHRVNGDSLQQIAAKLNENSFRTSKGCLFTATAVKRLLDR